MTPGVRITAARKLAEISTKDLDRLAGLKAGVTWAVENSATGNSEIRTLDAIAKALGLSLDWIVRGDGPEPTTEAIKAAVASARPVTTAVEPEDAA